jgi:hypothetical protein
MKKWPSDMSMNMGQTPPLPIAYILDMTTPETGQPDPEQAIGQTEARPTGRLLVSRLLMPQRQVCQA